VYPVGGAARLDRRGLEEIRMMASKRIDLTFTGVGRVAVYSGTSHARTFARIKAMLYALYQLGDLDTLRAIKDGTFKPLVVLHAYERGQLAKLTRQGSASLVDALWKFHETHEAGKSYRDDLATSVRHVARVPGAKTAKVQSLPTILRGMKDEFRGRPVAFNRLRTHMLAFASEHEGKGNPLWSEIMRVNRFKKAEGTRVRKLKRRPLTVAELDLVCAAFEDHVVHGGRKGAGNKGRLTVKRTIYAYELQWMAYTLATTGMRPAEYWERGEASWSWSSFPTPPSHINVHGTKTAAAKRPTFCIGPTSKPFCGEQFFREKFGEATTKALREGLDCYSLRRTFAKLCEDAGVVESRRKAYLGHGPKTVTDLYLATNVLPFVEEDAAKVSAWIAQERDRAATKPSLKLEAK
jgi:integrase